MSRNQKADSQLAEIQKWLATEKDRTTALVARKRLAETAGKLRKSG